MTCYLRVFVAQEHVLAVHTSDYPIEGFVLTEGVDAVIDASLDQPFTDSALLLPRLGLAKGLLTLDGRAVDKQAMAAVPGDPA